MLAHAGVPRLAGGIVGVDVFYVLSGYLITGLLLREHAAEGRLRIAAFYARRLKRLLPALLLMLVVTLGAAVLLLAPDELREQARSAPYAATWTSNLFFAFARMDYFASLQARDLFLHTWSLGVEEQYYLVWPWLLVLALRGPRRLPGVLGALFVAGLALFAYWSRAAPLLAFYQMPARVWQFALGAGAFVGMQRAGERLPLPVLHAAGLAGVALIAGGALWLDLQAPTLWLLVPSLGAALTLAAGTRRAFSASVLSWPPLVWVGDRSYSWYLWHWPFLLLGAAVGIRAPAGVAALVLASLVAAALSHALVERPLWKGAWARALPPRRAMAGAVVAMLVALGGPVLGVTRIAHAPPEGEAAAIAAARLDVPELYAQGCDTWYESAEPKACLFGNADAPHTAVMLGDSVGLQWFPLFADIYRGPQWRLVVLTKSACPMVDEDYFYPRIQAVFTVCREWRDKVLNALPQLKPDVVIVGSGLYPFTERQWVDGSARVLRYVRREARRVLVIAPVPALSFDGPGCLQRLAGRHWKWTTSLLGDCREARAATSPVAGYLSQAIAQAGGDATLLDLGDLVCPGGMCAARAENGTIAYRDDQHLTAAFVRSLVSAARERVVVEGAKP